MNYKYNEGYCKAFGQQLRRLREARGISMRGLAKDADIEYSQLSKIERGVVNTTISTVLALARTLDIPVKDLFDFDFPLENM